MKKLFGNMKLIIIIVVVLVVGGLAAYILLPTGLPKPIYIEIVPSSAESAAPTAEQTASEQPTGASKHPEDSSVVASYPEKEHGIMYPVGTRIVNLLDPIGRRYLKIDIVLEILPLDYSYYQLEHEEQEAAKEKLLEAINERKPVVDDALTSLLSSKSYEDIYNLEGKNQLRAEVQERLNEVLGEPRVVGVYFTEFIIQ